MTCRMHIVFSTASALVVIGAIIWGVVLVGTPRVVRLQRFDDQRLEDLQAIFREVQSLCHDRDIKDRLKRPLPSSLDEVAMLARVERISLHDPETGERYEYIVTSPTTYELCATFTHRRVSDEQVFWNHPPGQQCFRIDALDPP